MVLMAKKAINLRRIEFCKWKLEPCLFISIQLKYCETSTGHHEQAHEWLTASLLKIIHTKQWFGSVGGHGVSVAICSSNTTVQYCRWSWPLGHVVDNINYQWVLFWAVLKILSSCSNSELSFRPPWKWRQVLVACTFPPPRQHQKQEKSCLSTQAILPMSTSLIMNLQTMILIVSGACLLCSQK